MNPSSGGGLIAGTRAITKTAGGERLREKTQRGQMSGALRSVAD